MAGCFGIRLLHWGPMIAFTIIGTITTFTISCDLQWWPIRTFGGAANLGVFLTWNVLTLYNMITAAFTGPGLVPLGWKPEKEGDKQLLQYCNFCEGYKAPRSHHCRKCQRCVMKMDHHCPWINNCVGHFNHASFTYFLLFAPCGCIHALFIVIPSLYRAINREVYIINRVRDVPLVDLEPYIFVGSMFSVSLSVGVSVAVGILFFIQNHYLRFGTGTEPIVVMGLKQFISCMFVCGLAIGVILAVGTLFFIQMKSILKNESGIESWIKDKAEYRDRDEEEGEFIYPYYLGRWENFRMVIHWRRRPELNGIYWPVREGCNQYTLTVEQLKQKAEKRDRSVVYAVQHHYNGSFCPVTWGCRVCCQPPCSDEPRIKIQPDDKVLVSRWKKHWLYGEKFRTSADLKGRKRVRGWFPRKCVIEETEEDLVYTNNHEATQVKETSSKKED